MADKSLQHHHLGLPPVQRALAAMSLAGSLARGAPGRDDIDRALNSLAYGPREKRRLAESGRATLGFVNSGAVTGQKDGSVVLWDGRLDNRADLMAALAPQDFNPPEPDLMWLAWRKWGKAFLDHVYGEFACVIWDAGAGQLVLGRDVMGTRSLYFHIDETGLIFASEPRGIWASGRAPRRVNENRLGQWLSLSAFDGPETLYDEIERVLPGHCLIWDGESQTSHRYWRPEELPEQTLPDAGAYAAALRAKLEAAVRRRLPAQGDVACQLSAGLDSAAVTALAAKALAETGRRLTAFTAAPRAPVDRRRNPRRILDEFPAAASVAALYPNIDHVRIDNDAVPLLTAMQQRGAVSEAPVLNPANLSWALAIEAEARRRGIRTMLVGDRGNLTFSYQGWLLLPELVRRGRWLRLLRAWRDIQRGPDRQPWLSLMSLTFGPVLPTPVMQFIRRLFDRSEEEASDVTALNPEFAARHGLTDEAVRALGMKAITNGRKRRTAALDKFDLAGIKVAAALRLNGVEISDPTSDRELIEFCLTVPEDQYLYEGETRSLARRALKGLLPDAFLAERRKGLQAADWPESLAAARDQLQVEVDSMAASPAAAKSIDIPRLKRLLAEWPADGWNTVEVRNNYLLALTRGVATGQFIRRMEGRND